MALVFSEQGRYDDALEWYIRALIGRKRTLGLDDPDTQSTRRCLEKVG
jgi:hypothetical protein